MLRDETDLKSKKIYLGRTLFADPRGKINRVEPLAQATNRGWQPIDDYIKTFPSEGKVFTIDKQLAGKIDYFILFTTIENERNNGGSDQLLVHEWCEPIEFIEGFQSLTQNEQRVIATEIGLQRKHQRTQKIIIPLNDTQCVFPDFREDQSGTKWVISPLEHDDRIDVFKLPEDNFGATFDFLGRYFALPGRKPDNHVGIVNWQSDADFLEAVLKTLKRSDSISNGDLSNVSQTAIRRLIAAFGQGELLSGDERLQALHHRLATSLPKLELSTKIIDEIASQLLKRPEVAQRIDVLIDELRASRATLIEERLENQMRQEISTRFQEEEAQVEAILADVIKLTDEKRQVQTEIETLRLTYEEISSKSKGAFGTLLNDLKASGEIISQLINLAGPNELAHTNKQAPSDNLNPPWTITRPSGNCSEISVSELPATLANAAKITGIDLNLISQFDILTRSGEMPLLEGDAVTHLINIYAKCVSDGEIHWMTADPTILSLNDLWINYQSSTPRPLQIAWQQAVENPERCVIFVLDQIDLASLTDLINPLRSKLRDHRPQNLVMIATHSARGTEKQDFSSELLMRIPDSPATATGLLLDTIRSIPNSRLNSAQILENLDEHQRENLVAASLHFEKDHITKSNQLTSLMRAAISWRKINADIEKIPYQIVGVNL